MLPLSSCLPAHNPVWAFPIHPNLRARSFFLPTEPLGLACTQLPSPLPLLSFRSLTTVKFCKPLVLITIRDAGDTYLPPRFFPATALQICTFVFNSFQDAPPAILSSSAICIVAPGVVPLRARNSPEWLSCAAPKMDMSGKGEGRTHPTRFHTIPQA